jgi:ureidoglycolate lyase
MESFAPYGVFAQIANPPEALAQKAPVTFTPDMALLNLGNTGIASFSVCRVEKRENVVDTVEMHRNTSEGILPLDGDAVIHVGKATPNGVVPFDELEAFIVPKGTFVALKRGVWHFAPFAWNCPVSNVLIVLPERTYAEDCLVVTMPEGKKVLIK